MPTPIDGLFVRLINHRVSDEHARWEDYLTECFVHLLEHDHDLQERLLGPEGLIFGGQHAERGPRPGENLTFTTQVSLDRYSRPDVHITGDQGFLLLVECKAGAPYDPRQIRRYLQHASKHSRGSVAALIPRRGRPVDSGVDDPEFQGIVEWEQVVDLLRALPAAGEAVDLLRASLLQLLDTYGLVPIEGKLPWEQQDSAEGVEAVRSLCRVLSGEARLVAGDAERMGRAPDLYRPDDGRWRLLPGQLIIQGKGKPPRKVMAHPVVLHPGLGSFGAFVFNVGFMHAGTAGVPTVSLIFDMQRRANAYQRSASKFLQQYLLAGGLLQGQELEFDEHRAMDLWARAVRRGTRVMQRVAEHSAMRELFDDEHMKVSAVGSQIWLTLAPTTALLGQDSADPVRVAVRYRKWLEVCLDAFFDSDPTEPVARLVAEAVMPSIGRC